MASLRAAERVVGPRAFAEVEISLICAEIGNGAPLNPGDGVDGTDTRGKEGVRVLATSADICVVARLMSATSSKARTGVRSCVVKAPGDAVIGDLSSVVKTPGDAVVHDVGTKYLVSVVRARLRVESRPFEVEAYVAYPLAPEGGLKPGEAVNEVPICIIAAARSYPAIDSLLQLLAVEPAKIIQPLYPSAMAVELRGIVSKEPPC